MSSFRPRHRNSFPNRTAENSRKTSESDVSYNCFGWACGQEVLIGLLPGYFWPDSVPRPERLTIESLVSVYATMGFEECDNTDLEHGFQKIAIYGDLGFADQYCPAISRTVSVGYGKGYWNLVRLVLKEPQK